jgi:hemerythrin
MSTITTQISKLSPDYIDHNAEIDRQHQIPFNLLKRLHDAMLLGRGKEILGVILSQAKAHASEHRAYEEKLMADTRYPDYREHIQQHEELQRKTSPFFERFERGETTMTIELSLFISSWTEQHIKTTDRRLLEYLSARRSTSSFRGAVGRRNT